VVEALVHLHHYFAGALLAFVLHRRAAAGQPAVPWLGSASLIALGAVYLTSPDYNKVIHQLGKQAGILLPLYLGVVAGFAEGADPFCRLLDRQPRAASVAREVSLGVYLLQQTVLTWLSQLGWCPSYGDGRDWWRYLVFFLPLLHLTALAVHYGVQRPIARCYASGSQKPKAAPEEKPRPTSEP
jgi:hypothetical protein